MVERLISSKLVPGVHFCTLNLEKSVRTILENLGWVSGLNRIRSSPLPRHNQLIEDDTDVKNGVSLVNGNSSSAKQINGLSISPSEASQLAQWGLTNNALPPAPKKGLGNSTPNANGPQGPSAEDSWDEYPNGRFTDVRSPAYGEIDGWGGGIKMSVRREATEMRVLLNVRHRLHKHFVTGVPRQTPCNYPPFSLRTCTPTLPRLPHPSAIYHSPPNRPQSCRTLSLLILLNCSIGQSDHNPLLTLPVVNTLCTAGVRPEVMYFKKRLSSSLSHKTR